MAEKKSVLIPDEAKEAAEKQLKEINSEEGRPLVRRRREQREAGPAVPDPSVPLPEEVDIDDAGPSAFFVKPVGEITGYQDSQEFEIIPELVEGLPFTKPGANLPKKRLFTIKGIHKDGRLSQFPMEAQINNQAAGDPQDALGLRKYQRKGVTLLLDWETMQPVYCPAWGCWARGNPNFWGFCTSRHAEHTLPNKYKDAQEIMQGMFSQGVTTSRTWEA
jgi:hypothetical protein